MFKLPPPENFNFSRTSEWPQWKTRFERFRKATKLDQEPGSVQVSTLIYTLGSEADKIFQTFTFDPPEQEGQDPSDSYDIVLQKFENYFIPRRNIIHERAQFHQAIQNASESIESYLRKLFEMADKCNFNNKEENIRDQLVIGLRDKAISRKLQLEADLTLDKAISVARTFEAVSMQMQDQRDLSSSSPVVNDINAIERGRGRDRFGRGSHNPSYHYNQYQNRTSHVRGRGQPTRGRGRYQPQRGRGQHGIPLCGNCANSHGPRQCPAYGKQCNFCKTFNHFEKCCRKKVNYFMVDNEFSEDFHYTEDAESYFPVNNVDIDPQTHNSLDIWAITSDNVRKNDKDPWTIILKTPYITKNNKFGAVKMFIDTQAQCNTLSLTTFNNMRQANPKIKLDPTYSTIKAFGNKTVKPVGKTSFDVEVKDKVYTLTCEVVQGENIPNLLGAEDSQKLNLIKRVNQITKEAPNKPKSKPENKPVIDDAFLKRIPNLESVPKPILEILSEFKDRFPEESLGCIPGEVHLSLDPNYSDGPVSFHSRPIPVPLKEKTKEQLDFLEKHHIITKVPPGVPTPWCSQMHVVHKKDGHNVRICIDPKFLNKALLREFHPIKTIEDIVANVQGSKLFTVLDANMGFFQIQLDHESQLLTAFNTPWGRYMYQRLPMGISSAPEIYQRKIEEIFEGLSNFDNIFDDCLIHTGNLDQQCVILRKTLELARRNDLTFRLNKCCFAQPEVEFTGFTLTETGVKVQPEKVKAITDMPQPESIEDVRTFLGMATYLSKHIPNFSDLTSPLRDVIKSKEGFFFDEPQIAAFQKVKNALMSAPVLQYYSVHDPIVVSCDASQYGLGTVLMQNNHPIAYASKSLTKTEKAYAQIEKELLSIVFSCKKFHHLLYGRTDITIETDHLPLISIINKPLDQVPMRLQKMILKLQPYSFKLIAKPGKDIPVADALSRAPITQCYPGLVDDMKDFHVCATEVITTHSFSAEKLNQVKKSTANDPTLQLLAQYIIQGWPSCRDKCDNTIKPYWDLRDSLAFYDGIIFRGEKVLIPHVMQNEILNLVHYAHQGMVKSKQLARDVVYWKGMNKQIEDMVSKCATCQTFRKANQKEPMMSHDAPSLPYQYVSADLFDFENQTYLVVVDHYSNYIDVEPLQSKHTSCVITSLKSIFSTHGICMKLFSDNGVQFTSQEFKSFSMEWGFEVQTYSPTHSQANGIAEKAVSIAKNLLKKAKADGKDFRLALLDYRNTPRDNVLGSPVQRCMGRRTRTRLPMTNALLRPSIIDPNKTKSRLEHYRKTSKSYYDRNAKVLPELKPGPVRYRTGNTWTPAELIGKNADNPRSYKLISPAGNVIARNRKHLLSSNESAKPFQTAQMDHELRNTLVSDAIALPENMAQNQNNNFRRLQRQNNEPSNSNVPSPVTTTTRSGRVSQKPKYLNDYVLE